VTIARSAKQIALPPVFDEAAGSFFKRARIRRFGFSCSVREKVPRTRGLGSSATVRSGVLHGLNSLAGAPLDRSELFQLCAELEGHPDNAAPASFGGFTVAGTAGVQQFDVSPRLKFVVLIPDQEIETSRARAILPARINHADAVASCGNACAITAAFVSRQYPLLKGNFQDHFHQPFRSKLMPYLPDVIAAAERAGALGAFLSGSGSTIAAVTVDRADQVGRAMSRCFQKHSGRIVVLSADNHGARVKQHKS